MQLDTFTDSIEAIIKKHSQYLKNLKENLSNEIDSLSDEQIHGYEQLIRLQAEMVRDLKAILKNAKKVGTKEEIVDVEKKVDYVPQTITTFELFLMDINMTEDEFFGRTEINRDVFITKDFIHENFAAIIHGNLTINVEKIGDNFKPIVGEDIVCVCSNIGENFQPTCLGSITINQLKKIPKGFECTLGGSLFLTDVKEYEGTFDSFIGNSLIMENIQSFPSLFKPTIFGDLNLCAIDDIKTLIDNTNFKPILGEEVYLSDDYHDNEGDAGIFHKLGLEDIERGVSIQNSNGLVFHFNHRNNCIYKLGNNGLYKLLLLMKKSKI